MGNIKLIILNMESNVENNVDRRYGCGLDKTSDQGRW